MKAQEIFGHRVKDNLRYIDLHKVDDADLARMLIRVAREVEIEQNPPNDDLLSLMYGLPVDDDGEYLNDAEQRARIDQIRAKTLKDLGDAERKSP